MIEIWKFIIKYDMLRILTSNVTKGKQWQDHWESLIFRYLISAELLDMTHILIMKYYCQGKIFQYNTVNEAVYRASFVFLFSQ